MKLNRRELLGYSASALGVAALGMPRRAAAQGSELTIAYNVNLPSWDPTVGPSAVNPTIQGLYQSVFDMYIAQKPDLSFAPGLITEWGWNDDRTKVLMTVREGVTWHDGSPFTPEDVVWSLERAGNEKTGNPIQFVWKNVGNFKIDGNKITGDVIQFDPVLFKWMSFLTGYIMPKAYYEKVGPEGFEKAPIGTGPFVFKEWVQGSHILYERNPDYWDPGKPYLDRIVVRFIADANARAVALETGEVLRADRSPLERPGPVR